MKALRWIGVGVLALLLLAGAVVAWASVHLQRKIEVETLASAGDGDAAHGRELALQTLLCNDCHGEDLRGKVMIDDAPGVVAAPSLTRARAFEAWDRAIRHGVGEDGRALVLMPADGYAKLSVKDLRDLVAYLDALPQAPNTMPPTKLSPLGKVLASFGALHVPALELDHNAVATSVEPSEKTGLERGRYLLYVSGCRGCHGPNLEGHAMGPGMPTAPSLARESIQARGHAAFIAAMSEGLRSDGQPLASIMPWKTFAQWPHEDLNAVWLALTEQR